MSANFYYFGVKRSPKILEFNSTVLSHKKKKTLQYSSTIDIGKVEV